MSVYGVRGDVRSAVGLGGQEERICDFVDVHGNLVVCTPLNSP